MVSDRHNELIEELHGVALMTWAQEALLACLDRLKTGGLTSAEFVRVVDAWAGPGRQISVVYAPPWSTEVVGLRRSSQSEALPSYPDYDGGEIAAPVFGQSVADWDIGEPINVDRVPFWRDSQGVRWWGDFVS